MGTQIKHVAICTENYDRMAEFYKTIFGMKKITNGMTDATGNYNPERGHISDGLIGYALLQRQPGIGAGLDHFALRSRRCLGRAREAGGEVSGRSGLKNFGLCPFRRYQSPRSHRQSVRYLAKSK